MLDLGGATITDEFVFAGAAGLPAYAITFKKHHVLDVANATYHRDLWKSVTALQNA